MKIIILRWAWFLSIVSWFNSSDITGFEFIYPFIIVSKDATEQTINHETIHSKQQLECAIILYYPLYSMFYVANRLRGYNHYNAYMNIIFEKESYQNDSDKDYLATRAAYSWLKLF